MSESSKYDLKFTNARVLNVFAGDFLNDRCVALRGGKVAAVLPMEQAGSLEAEETVDLRGRTLVPGFIDAHVHIESSFCVPVNYARAVVPRGTTTVVADPHEIANVKGLDGIRFMKNTPENLPLSIKIMLPSCVPATSMETSGAKLNADVLEEMIDEPNVLGLGEMMNYPGVLFQDPAVLAKLKMRPGMHIDGHAPQLSGEALCRYIAAGVSTDHECTTAQEAMEKLSLGMWIFLREGSQTRDLEALAPIVNAVTMTRCALCSDDREPEDLLEEGHMDFIVSKAIRLGIPAAWAFTMASFNAARCFALPNLGAVAPGYSADLAVLSGDIEAGSFKVDSVYKDGVLVSAQGRCLWPETEIVTEGMTDSVKVGRLSPHMFKIKLPEDRQNAKTVKARVIGIVQDGIITRHLVEDMPVSEGCVECDVARDILKIAVVERHHASGNCSVSFMQGMGLRQGAFATTISHDSHNIIVAGTNDADMYLAVQELVRIGGGLSLVSDGKVAATLPLPVGGLMSTEPLPRVYEALRTIQPLARAMGCRPKHPFLCLAFMALPVVPSLKLSDRGLIDVDKFCFTEELL